MTERLADYFDGQSSRAHPVTVRVEQAELIIEGEHFAPARHYPVAQLQWPERTRAGSKVLKLPDGGSLHAHDDDAWQVLGQAHGVIESPVVKWQQSGWRVFFSLILIVVLGAGIFRWGVPLAARAILVVVPEQIDQAIGRQAFAQIDEQFFNPTELDEDVRAELTDRLNQLVAAHAAYAPDEAPSTPLSFAVAGLARTPLRYRAASSC